MKKTLALVSLLFMLIVSFAGCGIMLPATDGSGGGEGEETGPVVEAETASFEYNKELGGTMMFTIKKSISEYASQLVAVTRDGREIVIIPDANSLQDFDYYRNKLYVCFTTELAYVELNQGNGNYKLNHLADFEDAWGTDIVVTADAVYLLHFGADSYEKYSLEDNTFEQTSFQANTYRSLLFNRTSGSHLIYTTNDQIIKMADDSGGAEKTIDDVADLMVVHNNKVVYRKFTDGTYPEFVGESFIYYEYDIETETTTEISEVLDNNTFMAEKNSILPYNNGYIFFYSETNTNKWQIMQWDENGRKVIAEVEFYGLIYVSLLNKNTISIISDRNMGVEVGEVLNVTVDINTHNVTGADIDFVYTYDVWAEGFSSDNS